MAEYGNRDKIDDRALDELLKIHRKNCISIYLPTHVAGREIRQDSIRFRKLLSDASERLRSQGMSPTELGKLLAPAERIGADDEFWRHQSLGLGVFIAEDVFERMRIPVAVQEQLYIRERFHLLPLFAARGMNATCFVLALSQQKTQLYKKTIDSFHEVTELELPSIDAVLQYVDAEKQFQGNYGLRGGWHGHGNGGADTSERKLRIVEYSRLLDSKLTPYLQPTNAPLAVACVDYLFPLFRDACSYQYVLDEPIKGNVSDISLQELERRAGAILSNVIQSAKRQSWDIYNRRAGSELASTDPIVIAQAAYHGLADKVFIVPDDPIWAEVRFAGDQVEISRSAKQADYDLLDFIACECFRNGGEVHLATADELPGLDTLAATFRGPVNPSYFGLTPSGEQPPAFVAPS